MSRNALREEQPSATQNPSQLLRGLHVLELVAVRPATAAGVADELGVNRSTALRLLAELERAGFVRRHQDKRYSVVAERLVALAGDCARNPFDSIGPRLRDLRDELQESVNFSVPAGGRMVYLAYEPSPHAITVAERIGTTRPMYCSAIGTAFLAALDDESRARELRGLALEGGTDRAPATRRELLRRIDLVRAQGFALDTEGTVAGVTCIAVALSGESPLGSVGISAPSSRLDAARVGHIARRLREVFADMAAP